MHPDVLVPAASAPPGAEAINASSVDAELAAYIARRTEVLTAVRRMLVNSLNLRCRPETIDPDTPLFGTGLGIDSIDAVEIVVALEIEFGVKIENPLDRRRSLRSVNALVDAVVAVQDGASPSVHHLAVMK